jgi:aspartyl-tRNA(Asn)/glutamyl-tRNA(Gln) amidotransferase subunit A
VYTGWVNVCGHPAINLPGLPSRSGLPIGFQLIGRFGADELLLDVARRYEKANPSPERWPGIVASTSGEGAHETATP